MTKAHEERKERRPRDVILPMLIGTLGAVIVIMASVLGSGFKTVDVVMLLVIVAFAAVGYNQHFLRGLLTYPFLYVATAMSASFYVIAAPYIGAPFGDYREQAPPFWVKAIAFVVLMLVFWIALEAISRSFFKDMSLPRLGILDNFAGVFVYLLIGVLVASILFSAVGYGEEWRGRAARAKLRPFFRQVMQIHYLTQSFWFTGDRPWVYTGDLD